MATKAILLYIFRLKPPVVFWKSDGYNCHMTRAHLLQALANSRAALEAAFAGLSEAQLRQPGASGEGDQPGSWAVRDVLAHCAAWEAELVTALAKLRRGLKPGKTDYSSAEI